MQRSTSNFQRSTLNKGDGRGFDLEERLLRYAASVVRLVGKIPGDRSGNHVAGQLLRSGTSPLPNHGEAQAAESAADFVHKMHICLKEPRESRRWLKLINEVPLLKDRTEVSRLIDETEQLIKIFVASVRTAQQNAGKNKLRSTMPNPAEP